ncbi:hypothetical protein K1719_011180 [Acacia pycnantha]|nr:hypothetical protein K1719_011180 [Acacia pycnantha]
MDRGRDPQIGHGRYGTIFRYIHLVSGQLFAYKFIDNHLHSNPTDHSCLQNEPKYMSILSPHPNILQIFHVFHHDHFLWIVLELCHPHSLLDRILPRPFPETEAASVMTQLLETLTHCL